MNKILATKECAAALRSAEAADKYIDACTLSRLNMAARAGTTYTQFLLNDSDIRAYTNLLNEYVRYLPQRLYTDIVQVKIAILMPSADTGFPHTRPGNLICLPYSGMMPSLKTYIHELWHIHQRMNRDLWNKMYASAWGFTPFSLDKIPLDIRQHMRINPDTIMSGPYCWRNEWVALPIFQSTTQPKMGDIAVWFLNVRTGRISHSMPDTWKEYFHSGGLSTSAHEHPNELSAYMLAEFDSLGGSSPAFKDLITAIGATALRKI